MKLSTNYYNATFLLISSFHIDFNKNEIFNLTPFFHYKTVENKNGFVTLCIASFKLPNFFLKNIN